MLTLSKPISASQAQAYHKSEFANAKENYYTEGERVRGEWQGQLAERYGLRGEVNEEQFARLSEGQHPQTGEALIRVPGAGVDGSSGYDRGRPAARAELHRGRCDPLHEGVEAAGHRGWRVCAGGDRFVEQRCAKNNGQRMRIGDAYKETTARGC